MFLNSLLLIFLLVFSFLLFFINNIYIIIGLFVLTLILILIGKINLHLYKSFIVLIIINFLLNYLLSNINDALIVTMRLFIMFFMVNLIINKIGIYNLAKTIGNIFHNEDITLIIAISLSFIPIMIKELSEIRKSLITKNFPLTLKNVIIRPNVFVITFFSNLFKRVNDMEKVLISKGVEE